MATLKKLLNLIKKNKKVKNKVVKKELVLTSYEPVVQTVEEKFSSKILVVDDCWEWQGKLDRYGYGVFKIGNQSYKAHRYSYELYNGTFDKHLHVLHKCDNPKCVNPAHLFLGTNQDNIQDKISKGRSKINNRRLTNAEKVNILKLLEVKSKKDVAKTFNIHISTISRLKRSSIFDEQQNRV
jgi:hypothetical protein